MCIRDSIGTGATLANAATSASTPSTIVKRDANGDFAARTVTLAGDLRLAATTSDGLGGVITINGVPALHTAGLNNSFVGGAGNFTMTGGNNTAEGSQTLQANTT